MKGYVWALPNTLVGLCIAFLFCSTAYKSLDRERMIHIVVLDKICSLAQFFEWRGIKGMAIGSVMFFYSNQLVWADNHTVPDDLFRHEYEHVRQAERLGPFMYPVYFTLSLLCLIMGKDGYKDNPFELWAREAACGG